MERTAKPVVAGIFNIITGSLGLMCALAVFLLFVVLDIGVGYYLVFPEFITAFILTVVIIVSLFSLLVLVSGLYALESKYWGLVLAGSIVAVFGFLPLGIPALVDGEQVAVLDGAPQPKALAAEPSDWEQLQLGDQPERLVRFTTKGQVVKSLRLHDLRIEHDCPTYLPEVLIAEDEVFNAGSEITFTLILDLNPL